LARNISRGKGRVRAPKWGLGWMISRSIIHMDLHKPNNKLVSAWLEHFWCMNKTRTYTNSQDSSQFELEGNHHLPPYSILYDYLGFSKFSKLGLLIFWKAITSCANLWLRWGLKQKCNPCQELFSNMWHTTYTYIFQGDSRLLVGGNKIGTMIPDLFLAITCLLSTQLSHASSF
jgi:hypothetical protein